MEENTRVSHLLDSMTTRLTRHLDNNIPGTPVIVGIRTGGVWLAGELHSRLAIEEPVGELDISFYRDDFTRIGLNPTVKPSNLPFETDDRHILLVDDVIMSGRTIRAAMNELFDYGRPASITLIALVDIGRRELPIQPDIVGQSLSLNENEQVKLSGPSPLRMTVQQKPDKTKTG
ncbi:MAG: bifunctional pyr operon transcriptional regulator/uracil phosphoribosyltransferase [Proteobacteria bacterium]|nr:MAG: bifunctional pyr operon transcriptional regulator/uracil phosphoribosyltransferase [Pseudomonadota bacterium]